MVFNNGRIWMDGKLVDWANAQTHISIQSLHYGTAVFEGIRCYKTDNGSAVFRLEDHVDRLFRSANVILMDVPFSREEIKGAIIETIKENGHEECYIRPLIYYGSSLFDDARKENARCSIISFQWTNYLGDEALQKGASAMVSDFKRGGDIIQLSKVTGNYAKSDIAKWMAQDKGYDEAILLDERGNIAEGSAENIFLIKDNIINTPKLGTILKGITRDSILEFSRDFGYEVKECDMSESFLYSADEIFFTGTAAEIVSVNKIGNHLVGNGKTGQITSKLQKAFFDIVKGKNKKYEKWLTYV